MKVGVILALGEDEEVGRPPAYATVRGLALQAEAAGFDSVWLYDHLIYRFPDKPTAGVWEVWTLLSGLAEATERVELGTLVMCTAFRNPAVLAKMAVTLDELSNGRLILGLGAGWHRPEFDAFGLPFDRKVDRFEEALKIIVPLLREGRVDFAGSYVSAPHCELAPRGPRRAGPPILIAAFAPRMLRLTAEYADGWNTAWLGRPEGLAEPLHTLQTACAEAGRDPATLELTVGLNVQVQDPAAPASAEPIDPLKTLTGSAEEIARGLRGYEDLGVSHVICNFVPHDADGLSRLTDAVRAYRGENGTAGGDRSRR